MPDGDTIKDHTEQLQRIVDDMNDIIGESEFLSWLSGANWFGFVLEFLVFFAGVISGHLWICVIDIIVMLIHITMKIKEHERAKKHEMDILKIEEELKGKQNQLSRQGQGLQAEGN